MKNLGLLNGCTVAWHGSLYCFAPRLLPQTRNRTTFFRVSAPRARIFESCKQRGAASRSTIVVPAHGAVFEREPAGRGRGVFLRAAEGIRTSPDRTGKRRSI